MDVVVVSTSTMCVYGIKIQLKLLCMLFGFDLNFVLMHLVLRHSALVSMSRSKELLYASSDVFRLVEIVAADEHEHFSADLPV